MNRERQIEIIERKIIRLLQRNIELLKEAKQSRRTIETAMDYTEKVSKHIFHIFDFFENQKKRKN